MIDQTSLNNSRRSNRTRLLAVLMIPLAVASAPTVVTAFGYIIFDPANFSKNVQQAVALLQQIARASEQIRQQRQMLADLPATVAGALTLAGQSLTTQVTAGSPNPIADGSDVAGQLESRYPITFPKAAPAWLETMRPRWTQEQRQRLLNERDLAEHVHDQMAPTAERMATLIEASNGVDAERWELPGQVAVAQAHEELLAIGSGEANKLLAVRTARAQRQLEVRARAQSESAYRTARRNELLIDWNGLGKPRPETVRNPF